MVWYTTPKNLCYRNVGASTDYAILENRNKRVSRAFVTPIDLNLLLSTSQLGSSTSRAFVGHTIFADFAVHVLSGAAKEQGTDD
jgi:hypothetical protein